VKILMMMMTIIMMALLTSSISRNYRKFLYIQVCDLRNELGRCLPVHVQDVRSVAQSTANAMLTRDLCPREKSPQSRISTARNATPGGTNDL
jgi:hypothetical protein